MIDPYPVLILTDSGVPLDLLIEDNTWLPRVAVMDAMLGAPHRP